jgi:hypothetical protein
MDHQKIKELISPYHDGELDEVQKKLVEEHMGKCVECRKEFGEMGKFEEVMSQMKLKEPPKEAWKMYWTCYNYSLFWRLQISGGPDSSSRCSSSV